MKACSVKGCDRAHKAKGLCTRHYQRLKNSAEKEYNAARLESDIVDYLAKPRLSKDIAKHLSMANSTIWSALRRLINRGAVVKCGRGKSGAYYWVRADSESTVVTTPRKLLSMPWR